LTATTTIALTESQTWTNKRADFGNSGQYAEAIKAYDKAIEIKPQNSTGWYNRAHIYSLINNQDQSIINLNKAIELYSSYKEKAKKETTLKD
jgi:tetratricopeptide (TPR) repeat protein